MRSIEALGKAKRGFDKVWATTLEELPTVQKVIARVSNPEDPASTTYQQADIKQYTAGLEFVRDRQLELTDAVGDCLCN